MRYMLWLVYFIPLHIVDKVIHFGYYLNHRVNQKAGTVLEKIHEYNFSH